MRKTIAVLSALAISATPAWAGVVTVTPEPASVALMGAGLAALGFVAWRRKRTK